MHSLLVWHSNWNLPHGDGLVTATDETVDGVMMPSASLTANGGTIVDVVVDVTVLEDLWCMLFVCHDNCVDGNQQRQQWERITWDEENEDGKENVSCHVFLNLISDTFYLYPQNFQLTNDMNSMDA